jgi:phosphoglycolate phosphatase
MTRTLILDLDGTLIDSAADLRAALNRLMAARGLDPFTRPEVVGMIGDGVAALVTRGLAARGLPPDQAAIEAFHADYSQHAADESLPYPGTAVTLRRLAEQGWRLGVCTNKPEAPARSILRALGLEDLVGSVTGGDGPRKPDPRHMLAAVAATGGTPDRAIALGDHANDILAARAAGMQAIFAEWGYGPAAMAEGAIATAASIGDVPALANGLIA